MKTVEKEEFLSALFGEKDFEEKINTIVLPFLKEYAADGFFNGYDGKKIHYIKCIHPEEKGTIVVSHGFCEFFDKYHEVVYELFQMGYSIFFLEHRGHGKSYRDIPDQLDMVYINSYDEYVEDLKQFLDQIVQKNKKTENLFLFAHSMGGCIAGLFLEKYPQYFKAAILSSPMMQMNTGKVPQIAIHILMLWAQIMKKQKTYAPGQYAFNGEYIFDTSCTLSEARYRYAYQKREKYPEYRTYGGSYGWSVASIKAAKRVRKNAMQIKIPLLLFQAGNDSMVIPKGQDEFLSKIAGAKKIVYKDSKHEIFNATEEIRKQYYEAIWEFLENNRERN